MSPLTTSQIEDAEDILNNQGALAFYQHLYDQGHSYARLGIEITSNDSSSWQGQIAIGFANSNDAGIDVSPGTQNGDDLIFKLATGHLNAYIANGGREPTRSQIQAYHNQEYVALGLDADDWFPNRFLKTSSDPDKLWDDWQYNTSELDIIQDAFVIANDMAGAVIPMLNLYPVNAYWTNCS
tara:strand:+ start:117 stop:662 length:546 start_codon:yes stop_codon:yes gene_type:complete